MRAAWLLGVCLGCGAAGVSGEPAGAVRDEEARAQPVATWLKGQLHAHTDRSGDSATPPATALRWYAEHGFDFVVVTDHNFVTVAAGGSVLAIPGVELTQNVDACVPAPEPGWPCLLHVNALFVAPERAGAWQFPATLDLARRAIYGRALAATRTLGGLAQLNHPNFHYSADAELIAALVDDGLTLLEIANASTDANNAGDAGHPSTEALWDAVLTGGRTLYGVATDDAHHYDDAAAVRARGEPAYVGDRGWVMVRAVKEPAAIRAAIERGEFYASTGVVLTEVRSDGGALAVATATAHTVRFIGAGGAVLAEQTGTSARHALGADDGPYVRAVVTAADGRKAWTQPLWR